MLGVFNNYESGGSSLSSKSKWNFMIEVLVINMDIVFKVVLLNLFIAIVASSYFPLRKKYNNSIHAVEIFESIKGKEKYKKFKHFQIFKQ